jgi:hypothetical protein
MIPTWMLYASQCAVITRGSHRAKISFWLDLRAKLTGLGLIVALADRQGGAR